eukprot:scaffold399543_cov39-Prasinocladus_malaysianus.AAC.1
MRGAWLQGEEGARQEHLLWSLEAGEDEVEHHVPLAVGFGRTLFVPSAVRLSMGAGSGDKPAACRFSFEELCGSNGKS